MLADFLNTKNGIAANLHVQAIKRVKRKITDLDGQQEQGLTASLPLGQSHTRPLSRKAQKSTPRQKNRK